MRYRIYCCFVRWAIQVGMNGSLMIIIEERTEKPNGKRTEGTMSTRREWRKFTEYVRTLPYWYDCKIQPFFLDEEALITIHFITIPVEIIQYQFIEVIQWSIHRHKNPRFFLEANVLRKQEYRGKEIQYQTAKRISDLDYWELLSQFRATASVAGYAYSKLTTISKHNIISGVVHKAL